jgi:hypothetical protein
MRGPSGWPSGTTGGAVHDVARAAYQTFYAGFFVSGSDGPGPCADARRRA